MSYIGCLGCRRGDPGTLGGLPALLLAMPPRGAPVEVGRTSQKLTDEQLHLLVVLIMLLTRCAVTPLEPTHGP
jgi:hypothetical protein